MLDPTLGYEPEPAEVAAEVDSHLSDVTDPLERYTRATAAQAHHKGVAAALQEERDMALADLNAPDDDGFRLTYEQLSARVTVAMTPAGVQKAVERGRALRRKSERGAGQ